MRYALGIGLTNACNLSCAHCCQGPGAPHIPFMLANPEDLPKVGNACGTAVVMVG